MRYARFAWIVLAFNLAVVLWGAFVEQHLSEFPDGKATVAALDGSLAEMESDKTRFAKLDGSEWKSKRELVHD